MMQLVVCFFAYMFLASALHAEVRVINRNTPDRDLVIAEVLSLQKSLLAPMDKEQQTTEQQEKGFLLIQMTPAYVRGMLEKDIGVIVADFQGSQLRGYLLLTRIENFQAHYLLEAGIFDCQIDLQELERRFAEGSIGYIQQIGVKREAERTGIGSSLVAESQKLYPQGLIADIFLIPVKNEASLNFFKRKEFREIGTLYLRAHEDFPEHQTRVLYWTPLLP